MWRGHSCPRMQRLDLAEYARDGLMPANNNYNRPMTKRLLSSQCRIGLLTFMFLVCLYPSAQDVSQTPLGVPALSQKPEWTVNLRKYGYRGPRRGFIDDPGSSGSIAFSSSSVAVLFDEKAEEANTGDTKLWSGWRLSIVFLDPATGSLIAKRTWIGDLDWHRRLLPTSKGDFAFLLAKFGVPIDVTPNKKRQPPPRVPHPATLLLLSPSGEELKRGELSSEGDWLREPWQMLGSPSGRSILLIHKYQNRSELRLFNADALEQRALWETTGTAQWQPLAISDESLLFSTGKQYAIGRFGSDLMSNIPLPRGNSGFLGEDSIVTVTNPVAGAPASITITTITRDKAASINLGVRDKMEGATPPIVAANGQRFGTVIDKIISGRFLRKYHRFLCIWQRPGNDLVLNTEIPFSGDAPPGAISADGSAIAVLNAGKVAMYHLGALPVSGP